jgi:uncharacterized membrane protein
MPIALYALAVATFAGGTTEFVVVRLAVESADGLMATPCASIAMVIVALLIAALALHPQPATSMQKPSSFGWLGREGGVHE